MSEFAFWPQSHNSWTLRVGLPYDTSKDAGGSSSGSAAATAANLTLVATGSDTCASIRLPPSNNSLVGVRSSIGLVSQDGIVPLSHFLDVGGPITRTVRDAALMLDVMAGADPADPHTQEPQRAQPVSYASYLKNDGLRGKRIGVLRSYGSTNTFGSDPHVNAVMANALAELQAAGAVLVDPVSLPDFSDISTLMIVREFKTQIGEYLAGVPNAPRHSLEEIILSGQVHPFIEALLVASEGLSDTSSDAYLAAKAKREPLRAYVEGEMDRLGLDALVYPPVKAPAFGTLVEADIDDLLPDLLTNPGLANGNINAVYQQNTCALGSSTGMPSIVVPAGFSTDSKPLPIGIEFFGRRWDEGRLFEIAYSYEQATHHRVPPPGFD
jgi:Asp-tRNA(Asn)/Glu-tRNA(Gln) amidotransferase A subunit family amidase